MPLIVEVFCAKTLRIRKFQAAPGLTYEDLVNVITKNDANKKLCITYVDPENDFVSITNTDDLNVAIDLVNEKQLLKLFVNSCDCAAGTGAPGKVHHLVEKTIATRRRIAYSYLRAKYPRGYPARRAADAQVSTRGYSGAAQGDSYPGTKKISVTVSSANIYNTHDIIGKDDPYVTVEIGGVKKQTKVLNGTQNPVWNETLVFDNVSAAAADKAVVELYDEDKLTKDDLIGSTPVSLLPDANADRRHVSVALYDPAGTEQAKVELDIAYEPEGGDSAPVARSYDSAPAAAPAPAPAPEPEPAADAAPSHTPTPTPTPTPEPAPAADPEPAPAADTEPEPEPAPPSEHTPTPEPPEPAPAADPEPAPAPAEAEADAEPEPTTPSKPATPATPDDEVDVLKALAKLGEDAAGENGEERQEAVEEDHAEAVKSRDLEGEAPSYTVGTATVLVKSATVVKKSLDVLGKGDPYVVVKVADKENRTQVIMNTQSPVWNEKFTFEDIPYSTDSVTLLMYDRDNVTNDDYIGTAVYSLDAAKKDGGVTEDVELNDETGTLAATVSLEVEVKGTE